MSQTTQLSLQRLYDQDYVLWLETTVEQLKQGQFADVDLENLIEEIESMGRSEQRAIESLLTRLLEHLLKIAYWESQREQNIGHWSLEVTNFRYQISKLIADSPSLKPYLHEIFEESYSVARRGVSRAMRLKNNSLPEKPIATVEQTLDDNWFPIAIDE